MSRVGKQPITVPSGAKVEFKDGMMFAEGPKGKVSLKVLPDLDVKLDDGVISVDRKGDSPAERSMHGLMRALLANAVEGVTSGFSKKLEVIGVGYKAEVQGKSIQFALGFSHPVIYNVPEGISIEVDKQNRITVSGADRQQVGQVAAEIRGLKPPEPYKGKGIRYSDEIVRRKAGKAVVK